MRTANMAGAQGFVFARTVAEAQEYATAFSAAGLATACVHAGTPEDERAHALAQFRSGRVRLLSNVYVMTEGVDLPAASVCLLARSNRIGRRLSPDGRRILRPALGKTSATLIDLPGISHESRLPEDERMFSLEARLFLWSFARAKCALRRCRRAIRAHGADTSRNSRARRA